MIKKSFLFVSLIALAVFSPSIHSLFAQEDSASPTIVYLEGSVTVNISGAEWVSAEKNMALKEDSSIKTEDASYCDIAFDKDMKNIVSIGPNSEVKLGKALKQVNISKGRVFAELKALPAGSMFEVVTPQAIAGVRGTAWESIVGATAQFNVKDSTIYVKGMAEEGTKDVAQGNSVVVDPSGWLGELKELTKEDAARMEAWSSRIASSLGPSAKNCGGLIEGFTGASANLFGQVLECEGAGQDEAFASAGGDIAQLGGETNQGLLGGDITQMSFVHTPLTETLETPIQNTPPPVKPPNYSCCPATNPFCSC